MWWHVPYIQILAWISGKGFQCWFDDWFHICCSVSACLLPISQDAFSLSHQYVRAHSYLLKINAESACDSLCQDGAIAVYSQSYRTSGSVSVNQVSLSLICTNLFCLRKIQNQASTKTFPWIISYLAFVQLVLASLL